MVRVRCKYHFKDNGMASILLQFEYITELREMFLYICHNTFLISKYRGEKGLKKFWPQVSEYLRL